MSYFPKRHRATEALELLRKPGDDLFNNFPKYRVNALREVLTAMVCPCVCVGHVNDEGWHKICETKVDDAMAALGFETAVSR